MSFIGDLLGGFIQSDATKDAANTQANAANNATAVGQQQFSQTRNDYAPYRYAGYGALDQINALLGITPNRGVGGPTDLRSQIREQLTPRFTGNYGGNGVNDAALDAAVDAELAKIPANDPRRSFQPVGGGTSSPANALAALQSQPGYQFGLNQGQQAIDRSAASRGSLYSGATLKALDRFGQDYGGTKLNETYNRLAGVAGLGQTATGGTANAGQNFANQAGQNIMGAGNAVAAGGLQQGNIWSNAVNGLSAYGQRNGWFSGGGGMGNWGNYNSSPGDMIDFGG